MRTILIGGLVVAVAIAALAPFDLLATEEGTPPPAAPVNEFKPSGVELVEAGAEPRAPLRYKFNADIKEAMIMDMTIAMTMEMGGYEQPTNVMPTIRMVMEISGQEITEAGELKYGLEFTKVEVVATEDSDPAMVDAMEAAMVGTVGLSGWGIVNDRGVTRDMGFTVPEDANPAMVQQLDQMRGQLNQLSAPFPEEPIGVGAKWKVTQNITANGMAMTQVATYTLDQVLGESVKMSVTMTQSAPPQTMELPTLPPGATARLSYLESQGTGKVALETTRLVPDSQISLKMKMNMEITIEAPDMPPQSMPMGMKMDMDIKILPGVITETEEATEDESGD